MKELRDIKQRFEAYVELNKNVAQLTNLLRAAMRPTGGIGALSDRWPGNLPARLSTAAMPLRENYDRQSLRRP